MAVFTDGNKTFEAITVKDLYEFALSQGLENAPIVVRTEQETKCDCCGETVYTSYCEELQQQDIGVGQLWRAFESPLQAIYIDNH